MLNLLNWLSFKAKKSLPTKDSNDESYIIKSMDEYIIISEKINEKWNRLEAKLYSKIIESDDQICKIEGHCDVCNTRVNFTLDMLYGDGIKPNYRERMVCPICGLNNRQRFILNRTLTYLNKKSNVYIYEQITPFYKSAEKHIKNMIGSEYLGNNLQGGQIISGIRHEDACNLSFQDNTFNIVISNDVFEHVNDIEACLNEAARVLKVDGKLIMSIPFYVSNKVTERRAIMKENRIEYLKEAQYHGNPLSSEGSLVFYDFGWDIFDMLKNAGFRDSYMIQYYSEKCGHVGQNLYAFESVK
jgi:hypothetical protein